MSGNQKNHSDQSEMMSLKSEIARLRQANEALRTSLNETATRMNMILNNAMDAIYLWELDEDDRVVRCVDVNTAACEMLGYTRAELLRKLPMELNDTSTAYKVKEAITSILKVGVITFEMSHLHKNGTTIPVEIKSHFFKWNNNRYILSVTRDISARKKTESALQQSEERFRIAFSTSPDSINLTRMSDGCYVEVNEGFLKISGYSAEEIIGKTSIELNIWRKAEDRQRLVDGLREDGVVENLEADFIMKDGTIVRGLMSARIVMLDDEPHILSITRDFTEIYSAREAIAKSEKKYRGLFQNSPIGIIEVDCDGNVLEINPKMLEILGSPSEAVTRSINMFQFQPLIDAGIVERFKECINSGKSATHESAYTSKWGKFNHFRYHLNPVPDSSGTVIGVLANIEDISARIQFEESLKASEERFRLIIENSHEAICILDQNFKFEYVNSVLTDLFGYKPDYIIGKGFKDFLNREGHARIVRYWRSMKRSSQLRELLQVDVINKSGQTRQAEISLSEFYDSHGNAKIVAQILDITERVLLEEQVRQSQKMEAIGQLAGGIAHDFNNLLTVINGYAELGSKKSNYDNPLHVYFGEIMNAGKRAESLTRQLLAFSRKQFIRPVITDVNKVILGLDSMMSRLISEDILLTKKLSADLQTIKADPSQLEQVLVNLIINARDAIQAVEDANHPKDITVATANITIIDHDFSTTDFPAPGKYVRITISDSGTGMDKETQARVFEPFFTTKGRDKGTGLGMATVYGIIRQNDGHITVKSKPGSGSTFDIYWPVARGTVLTEGTPELNIDLQRGFERILLVEDDQAVRELASETLRILGYKVIEAGNGNDAIAIFKQEEQHIDILITDVVMPQMGGKELANRLKEIAPELKIIFTSGYAEDHILHGGVLEKDVHFLQKPYSLEVLSKKVRCVLKEE
jgi:two-component system cell cycle sensor histidine kinase/response regulator CckA